MRKSIPAVPVAALALVAFMAAFTACSSASGPQNAVEYHVISPWAEADPIPLRGISPRIDSIDGKKIGVFANFKRSAVPQGRMVEKKLKEVFPTIQTNLYHSTEENVNEMETANREKFTAWINSVDAVVAMVGD